MRPQLHLPLSHTSTVVCLSCRRDDLVVLIRHSNAFVSNRSWLYR